MSGTKNWENGLICDKLFGYANQDGHNLPIEKFSYNNLAES